MKNRLKSKIPNKSCSKMIEIRIPFSGFYESVWSEGIDYEIERHLEYKTDSDNEHNGEHLQPKELQLDDSELNGICWRGNYLNYPCAKHEIIKDYVKAFNAFFEDETGIKLELEFIEMTSPGIKGYNFETDRLFCNVKASVIRALFAKSKADKHKTLTVMIADNYTSRDGFWSSYSNDLASWLKKPLKDWDHNELEILLESVLTISSEASGRNGFDNIDFDYRLCENVDFCSAFEKAFDFEKFDKAIECARAEKLANILKENPSFVAHVKTPPCSDTVSLFQ